MPVLVISFQNEGGELENVSFDIVDPMSFEGLSEISSFPLESGAEAADHKIDRPDKFTVTGYVSNTPSASNPGASSLGVEFRTLTYPPSLLRNFDYPPIEYPPDPNRPPRNLAQVGGIVFAAIFGGDKPQPTRTAQGRTPNLPSQARGFFMTEEAFQNRCAAMGETLRRIRKKAYACEILTTHRNVSNMQLTHVVELLERASDGLVGFSCDFETVATTNLRQADVPIPAEVLAQVNRQKGSQSPKEGGAAKESSKRRSFANQLLNGGSGKVGSALKGVLGL